MRRSREGGGSKGANAAKWGARGGGSGNADVRRTLVFRERVSKIRGTAENGSLVQHQDTKKEAVAPGPLISATHTNENL